MKYTRTLIAALAMSLCATSSAAQSSSNLRSLNKDYEAQGWEAIGRLDLGGGFCSATLIAPDQVLTAAHCVYDGRGELRSASALKFNAGLRNGRTAASRQVAKIAVDPGFKPLEPLTQRNVSHDVALLLLANPIPTHEINPFILHGDAVRPGPVSVVSYGKGRETQQSRQKRCNLLERDRNVLAFDCNVTFGSSGAPVFSHLNGRGRILSVISGGLKTRGGKQIAVGPHLPSTVAALKRDLQAQRTLPRAQVKRITVGQQRSGSAKFIKVN